MIIEIVSLLESIAVAREAWRRACVVGRTKTCGSVEGCEQRELQEIRQTFFLI